MGAGKKAVEVYKAIPWQVQLAAVAAGIFLYAGWRIVKKIESGVDAVADLPNEIITGAQTTVSNALDELELKAIRAAQYGSAWDIFTTPGAITAYMRMKTEGYLIARTGEVFRIPPKD